MEHWLTMLRMEMKADAEIKDSRRSPQSLATVKQRELYKSKENYEVMNICISIGIKEAKALRLAGRKEGH